jgi:hypothetical protein
MAILLQTFSKGLILISFEVNRDFIAKNLCIRKDSRDNCCQGSCRLKKQLNEEDQKEKSSPVQSLKDKLEVVLFCELTDVLSFSATAQSSPNAFSYFFGISRGETSILHPPPQVS